MKKKTSNIETAAIVLTACLIQLAPVMDKYPVGGIILATIVAIIGICWKTRRKE